MKASHRSLAVPKSSPVRGPDGRWQQGKGDRLLEAHRAQQKAQDAKPKA